MSNRDERNHYRIVFPIQERPVFESFGIRFTVLDVSERGIKFLDPHDQSPAVHAEMLGKIVFKTGQECIVRGEILRRAVSGVVVSLNQTVPLPLIMEVQRDLLKRYKDLEVPQGPGFKGRQT